MPVQNVSRRDAVKWLLSGCVAAPLLASCGTATRSTGRGRLLEGRRLAPVLVAPELVIREVAGLRPFRPSGFALRADRLDEKTVIHNYGHGGGGVSLSWGTADLAARLALETPHRRTAVLGCGVVGLTSARLLQDRGFEVTIYARDLPPNTTSNIAGAQWSPVTVVDSDRRTPEFDAQFVSASRYAFRYFQNLIGARYGVWWRANYFLSDQPPAPPRSERSLLADLLHRVPVPAGEHPFGSLRVTRMMSMHIEPAIFLAAVLQDFRLAGGKVVITEFADLPSVAALPEPLIVNCTGLGARALFGDGELLPIKGQLTVLLPQPEVDYITVGPGDLYMMPRQDGIVLGGTHERDVWTLEPNPLESERILQGHRQLFEAMA
ncbi:MAG: FAD-binding oxidoreductase [Gemmatimonadetes bacterium]|nr:FAD-binding oxidoreductase [Gemmatimonadota bacterium]